MTQPTTPSANSLLAKLSLAELIVKILDDRKAANILQIDVRDISSVTDDVIIATATAAPHLRALTDRIGRDLREIKDIRPRIVDGTPASGWMLMDYPNVMVHLLTPEVREHYDIEGLWADAPRVETLKKIMKLQSQVRIDAEKRIKEAASRTSVRPTTATKSEESKATPAKKTVAKKATTKKVTEKAPVAKKAATAKKTVTKKAPAKTVAKKTTTKSGAKKTVAPKKATTKATKS